MSRFWLACICIGGSVLACAPANIKPAGEPAATGNPPKPSVVERVRVGFNPIGVAVTPDGQFIYTADSTSQTVTKVSSSSLHPVSTIQLGVHPVGLAVAPKRGWICVTARDEHNLTLLDIAGNFVAASIDLPYNPEQVAVNAEETMAYISNTSAPFVTVVDLERRRVMQNISVGSGNQGLALSPDGKILLITLQNEQYNLVALSTADQSVLGRTNAGSGPGAITIDAAGVYAYVANQNSNDVSMVHLPTVHTVLTFPVGQNPMDIKLAPSGKYLYVTSKMDNQLSIIDVATHQFVQRVDLDVSPWGLGLAPDGRRAFVANYELRSSGSGYGSTQPNMTLGNSATQRVNNNTLLVIDTGIYQ
jgi:YVTN family beta-propeller protein